MLLELIQSFWNSPGFLGIGITQVRGETYLYLKPEIFDWQKKTLLQLDLQNNVQNFAIFYPKMKFCQIKIMGYAADVLKLGSDVAVSVLSETNANSLPPIDELKLIGDRLDEAVKLLISFSQNQVRMPTFLKRRNANKPVVTLEEPSSYNEKTTTIYISKETPEALEIKDIITLLTRLTKFSSLYIGKKIAVNYLQATRPQFEWLQKCVITDSAEITFLGTTSEEVSSTQLIWFREWVIAFAKKCSEIFPYLPTMLEKQCLTEQEKKLLNLVPK